MAIFLPLYFCLAGKARIMLVVLASYIFYSWWDYRFITLLAGSTLVGFYCGKKIYEAENLTLKRTWLMISVATHLVVLGVFKYLTFFSEGIQFFFNVVGLSASIPILNVLLPVGISFFTFQTLSYTIDLYRDKIKPEPKLINFAAYVSFFPQLVAGPIVRASALLPQLAIPHTWDDERAAKGIEWIIWGLFLKLCLADNAAQFVDIRYGEPSSYTPLSLALSTFFFAFQIYGDFAGYSLIAIGIGKILGFDFGVNFNKPYFSRNFSDFWQRWHISLSAWIRDYIYVSMGGGRSSGWITARNLIVTMLLGGLWHGAGLQFIVWGLLHGVYQVLQRLAQKFLPKYLLNPVFSIPTVFVLTCIAWIFFRANSLTDGLFIFSRIIGWEGQQGASFGGEGLLAVKITLIIGFTLLIDLLSSFEAIKLWYERSFFARIVGCAFVIALIPLLGAFGSNQFIYFQF